MRLLAGALLVGIAVALPAAPARGETAGAAATLVYAVLPVTPEQCDDPIAAQGLFDAQYFVMDVQLHHVDLTRFSGPARVFRTGAS